ncbi:hypothetical protein FB567DRAFT_129220 [Paraphoma chrysanthemicola]|uniref:Uncharacterized protein n=1 Tax=Paraphoma chrysanthemicola TaxID=798071 RepID=A0A8K0R234_9PLEO|nr:hypothetical protein FB567DRAFT_129220 [Paraphoma chrysanthemicola]
MFSKDPKTAIFNDKTMDALIKRTHVEKKKRTQPHDQPRVALQRMRAVVGAYLYFTDDRVNKIFVDQVDRIGNRLELLEAALSKNPRAAQRENPQRIVMYNSWKPLKLKEKWYTYMDDVYETANNKGTKFMKDNIKRLRDEYTDAKRISQAQVDKENDKDKQKVLANEKKLRDDMPDYISKLEAAWSLAQNWPKPKWNAAANPSPTPAILPPTPSIGSPTPSADIPTPFSATIPTPLVATPPPSAASPTPSAAALTPRSP